MSSFSKLGIILVLSGITFLGLTTVPVIGHAADAGTTVQQSTATLKVEPVSGSDGSLTLTSVPSYDFSKTLDSSDTTLWTTPTGKLTVDDETGTGAGWTVSVDLSDFTNAAGTNMSKGNGWTMGTGAQTTTYAGSPTQIGTAPHSLSTGTTLTPGNQAVGILSAGQGEGLGTWSTTFSDAKLNFAKLPAMKATYTATMNWTLTSGPTSDTTSN
ncbi:hypothetical protein FD04_GL000471 [Secundilactobacillus odoratitofui DSM 19909 = JCM 15043]|uniref:WxL domain-containing protein n=1 Tax=Secundilactobacillus odoratitofui DSM 19909 = JCM 15043 TaxID=1423776 RepID=A0A0R1LSX0_9LACO|nr:WxL domain-containing protein [Secundilactobacillus odoratitofui]KRK98735.1 hypothetical protein FD04_GL000471 [Secundilactobacillus odoratitofui DSM 19909 = JCM 15043]